MLFTFLPYDRHCDDGLGAMGDEFEAAARTIGAVPGPGKKFDLARCFLFRHAIELYLKSAIVILHRGLKIPYGDKPCDGVGHVKIESKWRPIHKTHSIGDLWTYLRDAMRVHAAKLAGYGTDFESFPEGLEEALVKIDELDRRGTFFRYPDGSRPDCKTEKSAWGEVDLTESPVKMFLLTDAANNVTDEFQHHADTLEDTIRVLEKTAHDLTGLHVALRCELLGGA